MLFSCKIVQLLRKYSHTASLLDTPGIETNVNNTKRLLYLHAANTSTPN